MAKCQPRQVPPVRDTVRVAVIAIRLELDLEMRLELQLEIRLELELEIRLELR